MISDLFTKPLQGSLFKLFHDFILNFDPEIKKDIAPRSVLENLDNHQKTTDIADETSHGGTSDTGSPVEGTVVQHN
jgi:hypothetical protein